MDLQFLGAASRVTGSCYLIRCNGHQLLLECGQIQGSYADDQLNRVPLPIIGQSVDAVVLSHAHIDHSGRLPLLAKLGFRGPIYTHPATCALCAIMLRDSGYLHEKDAEWENRKRDRKGLRHIDALYTREDAEAMLDQFTPVEYDQRREILPGVTVRFRNAGHILGSAIVELWLVENGIERKVVFSGDLGFRDAPLMPATHQVHQADLVLLESTYGDRKHRSFADTLTELGEVFHAATRAGGNVIIPAFAVGRTQDLIYLMTEHFDEWDIGRWQVFLDSPMAIHATEVYGRFRHLYDPALFKPGRQQALLDNLVMSETSEDSMRINEIESGAIVIAGSGMCTGGRVMHHLKHNAWRAECHIVIVGYQAYGTLGRKLVDGARHIRLWGETIRVNASIHTVGGLSAHADQSDLLAWYGGFRDTPPVCLVHGEPAAQSSLARRLESGFGARVRLPALGDRIDLAGNAE